MAFIVYGGQTFMQMCVCVYVNMYIYIYVYIYMCVCVCVCVYVHYRLLIKYHQLTLQANSYIDLWLHNNQQNKHKNIHSDGRCNLISSAGEPEQQ